MFDFFFDTADTDYIRKTWDDVGSQLDPSQVRGITTNPNAFMKIEAHQLGEWEKKLPELCSLVTEIKGDDTGVVYVQAPRSTMTPEEVISYAQHISQFSDGTTKLGLKIPPFQPILEVVDELNKYMETNVTGLSDCSTALSCLSYNVRYISLIPGRMEEKGVDAKSHVLFTRRRKNEGTSLTGEIIAGSMRTIDGLEWVCNYGTVPTIGTRVWDQIVGNSDILSKVATFGKEIVSCRDLNFSPHIIDVNTQLSVDFFQQMDECGKHAHKDFISR